jgi:hypothetical protein
MQLNAQNGYTVPAQNGYTRFYGQNTATTAFR